MRMCDCIPNHIRYNFRNKNRRPFSFYGYRLKLSLEFTIVHFWLYMVFLGIIIAFLLKTLGCYFRYRLQPCLPPKRESTSTPETYAPDAATSSISANPDPYYQTSRLSRFSSNNELKAFHVETYDNSFRRTNCHKDPTQLLPPNQFEAELVNHVYAEYPKCTCENTYYDCYKTKPVRTALSKNARMNTCDFVNCSRSTHSCNNCYSADSVTQKW